MSSTYRSRYKIYNCKQITLSLSFDTWSCRCDVNILIMNIEYKLFDLTSQKSVLCNSKQQYIFQEKLAKYTYTFLYIESIPKILSC